MASPCSKSSRLFGFALCIPLLAWASGDEKIYVAVEGGSVLAVFDAATRQLSKRIDLSLETNGWRTPLAPHNVQVAPDGSGVWVTANGVRHAEGQAGGHGETGHGLTESPADQVIVIDPITDTVTHRIPVAPGLHLAHIVVTPDGTRAFATAQTESAIYEIDAREFKVIQKIQAPPGSQPHGLRLSPDGSHAYIALLQAKSLGILNTATGQLRTVPLDGAPVQTAVTPDGRFVLTSLYDTQRIAVYETTSQSLRYIDLLGAARGPVQLYPTPDSRYVYVADQGHYFGQPDSEWIYKVDLRLFRTVWSIRAGSAPHGIVIGKDGRHAYVTNLVGDDLSVIDLQKDQEIARLPVGAEPNGISLWNKNNGGTP
jgi:YVTN family beta-propeller protein